MKLPVMKPIRQLAEETGTSYIYLRGLIREGEVAYIQAGKKFLINEDSLAEYLNRKGVKEE